MVLQKGCNTSQNSCDAPEQSLTATNLVLTPPVALAKANLLKPTVTAPVAKAVPVPKSDAPTPLAAKKTRQLRRKWQPTLLRPQRRGR